MKNIYTLVPDIQHLIGGTNGQYISRAAGTEHQHSETQSWFTEDIARSFSDEITTRLQVQFGGNSWRAGSQAQGSSEEPSHNPSRAALRLSQMGPRCPRALWASVNAPEEAEPLPPSAQVKYAFGHLIEGLAIGLAKASGHEVTGEQDELILDDVKGHRDCVIDGCIVDVKSASSRSFQKFKDGSIGNGPGSDLFGYLDQLDGYVVASANDPLVRVKDRGYLFVIDKTLGHMVLYEHKIRPDRIRKLVVEAKQVASLSEPPACTCETVADGKSGNIKLGVKGSYNNYKYFCNPKIRTFIYSDGPRYLTQVIRKPDVTEVDRYGKVVYN